MAVLVIAAIYVIAAGYQTARRTLRAPRWTQLISVLLCTAVGVGTWQYFEVTTSTARTAAASSVLCAALGLWITCSWARYRRPLHPGFTSRAIVTRWGKSFRS